MACAVPVLEAAPGPSLCVPPLQRLRSLLPWAHSHLEMSRQTPPPSYKVSVAPSSFPCKLLGRILFMRRQRLILASLLGRLRAAHPAFL